MMDFTDDGPGRTGAVRDVQHIAPELLDPYHFDLKSYGPTTKSDIYAFGVIMYQVCNIVSLGYSGSSRIQVITRSGPFPGRDGQIIFDVISGRRPVRPTSPNEWLPDDVWNLISRSLQWDDRPDADFAMNALNDAADAVEVGGRKLHQTASDLGRTSHPLSGAWRGYRP